MKIIEFLILLLCFYSCSPRQEYTISNSNKDNINTLFSTPIPINTYDRIASNKLFLQFIHIDSLGQRRFLLQFSETGKEWNSINQVKIIEDSILYQSQIFSTNFWGNSNLPNLLTISSFEIPYEYLKNKTKIRNKKIKLLGKYGSFDFYFDEALTEKFLIFQSFVKRSIRNF